MNIPSIKCKIEIFCTINHSEDPTKVKLAILNLFPGCKIEMDKFSIHAYSENLTVLEKIHEAIHSMKYQRIYKLTLEKNLIRDTTWFYLNKQAAFAEKIAICENPDESPLGPLKVVLTSLNIERIIEWLIIEK